MSTNGHLDPNDISDWFWDIIHSAEGDRAKLQDTLKSQSDDQVYRFALEFMAASDYLRGKPFIDHIYVGKWKSEDDIADMSYWVVSQGKEFFMTVWHDPVAVSAYESAETANLARLHSFEFIAEGVLDDRSGEWPEDIVDTYGDFLHSEYSRVSDYLEARQVHEQ